MLNNPIRGNPCDPNPCQNGGVCLQNLTTGSLFCKCPTNVIYTGNKFDFANLIFLISLSKIFYVQYLLYQPQLN